ncbi:cytochrome P450 [Xanthomonas phaseoli]|uniref:Cytochrome n=1 Tax=Xanthomonas phaseoli pv. dieffenbachiae TaxID=92828 RepID=A0A1V9GW67_9XANT|nr:cytochrome P450 [Xanthomonas phaseoli]MBO9787655.1 cytochrome P450 [Xanthomonas phaseoli pv. dieffenbachiae]MBO9830955.1 cytochrome P450 [Xanthomonas phaseoli pv. dieffenbachiae]MBO9837805.1 cytochrome P450 [Xanthomonas phaseoli pv. dieffenbachiae]MBO9841315.1 cytochrome P450 [Xanthomonas phaseoli pv. dieffenbachiae]MBO9852324.1 cytochrome P450 [Xanthomonas phaseoli pv. dieffenbachiae]
MPGSSADAFARATVFAPRLQALLDEYVGKEVFRLDAETVGVAGPVLTHRLLDARAATEVERPTFKPLHGRSIPRTDASKLMQAIGRDVREALKRPVSAELDLSGPWPHVGHVYLRDLLLAGDPLRLRLLMDRILELTPKLTWAVIAAGAAISLKPQHNASALATLTAAAGSYDERRYAMGLYRRTAAPVCFTISTLVANALWLGSPFDPAVSSRHIVYESLRLLPPSWNILRHASPEYPALDGRIGSHDDVLVLPLLSHRDPALWEAPEAFRPERWDHLDPDNHPGYLPFGHASERCWGRHMVMPLAERLLDALRSQGLAADPKQRKAVVPLTGLLGVAQVDVVRH